MNLLCSVKFSAILKFMSAIDYTKHIDDAMRGMVRDILRMIGKTGLPEDHLFYITFYTNYPGVMISPKLKARYPEKMTIVLQYQFWDFTIDDDQFGVSLSFGGVPEHLVIPYAAMTEFVDPSVKFGLQFQSAPETENAPATSSNVPAVSPLASPPMPYEGESPTPGDVRAAVSESGVATEEPDAEDSPVVGAEIISLDSFRKS